MRSYISLAFGTKLCWHIDLDLYDISHRKYVLLAVYEHLIGLKNYTLLGYAHLIELKKFFLIAVYLHLIGLKKLIFIGRIANSYWPE